MTGSVWITYCESDYKLVILQFLWSTVVLSHLGRSRVWWSSVEFIISQLCSSRDGLRGPCAIVDVELAVRVGGHGQQLQ